MNYQELEQLLYSERTLSNHTTQEIYQYFLESKKRVSYEDDCLFVFHNDREFQNRHHIIDIHQRNNGKVPMHIFHYILITYCYSGKLTILVGGDEVELQEGDIIIFDKHVPHSVEATGAQDLGINIILGEDYFSKKFINHLPNDALMSQFMFELMNRQKTHGHYLVFHTKKDHLVHNCVQNILCEHYDFTICSNDLIDNYIMILVTHLVRKFQYNTNLSATIFKNQKLLDDILDYIKKYYMLGNLQVMCREFGYDPSYTSKLIKKYAGKTFKQLVNEERMKNAVILLNNKELPIYEIAETVGFKNLTSFYKNFYTYMQCTPQEYRKRQ
ncbi:helix-turn-helix domain-containing protein [Listeria costaricensis]|uniref:helix-turn-helix domain-containing protein n=1 Tax=Listeria costaricensis TaxID=2026604 RepID=UPI000C07FF06|nr:helix-turn-helix transcriptional regulator [Listeria costaricensis]